MYDIERGMRTNYRRETLMAVEAAYGWYLGSIAEVTAGGEPWEIPQPKFTEEEAQALGEAMRDFLLARERRGERSA